MTHQTRISEFDHAILQIRVSFLKTLEEHLENLRRAADDLVEESEAPEVSFARVSEIAHRIHGVARTLGFSSLGDVAVEAERAADAVLQTPMPPGQIGLAIDLLADLISAISATLGEERERPAGA